MDLGHHDLQKVADVREHAIPRNGVAAVDDVVRRVVQGDDQGRGRVVRVARVALHLILAHDRLRRSERAGEPGDVIQPRASPGRAFSEKAGLSQGELAAHHEVCDVREASPERVAGDEGAPHIVFFDEGHDPLLVPAEGVLDQADVRAVRVDFLGL